MRAAGWRASVNPTALWRMPGGTPLRTPSWTHRRTLPATAPLASGLARRSPGGGLGNCGQRQPTGCQRGCQRGCQLQRCFPRLAASTAHGSVTSLRRGRLAVCLGCGLAGGKAGGTTRPRMLVARCSAGSADCNCTRSLRQPGRAAGPGFQRTTASRTHLSSAEPSLAQDALEGVLGHWGLPRRKSAA